MNDKMKDDSLYRLNAGVVLMKGADVFVAKRVDTKAWQMPQGGIEKDEEEDEGMLRELQEEIGVSVNLVEIVKRSKGYYYYELPPEFQKTFWHGNFKGQKQRWYCIKFLGQDEDINLNAGEKPEFSRWRWVEPNFIIRRSFLIKRPVYKAVFREFGILQ
jgi:putative (di)nucleoside polyphosphate hydrolase